MKPFPLAEYVALSALHHIGRGQEANKKKFLSVCALTFLQRIKALPRVLLLGKEVWLSGFLVHVKSEPEGMH